MATTEPAPPPGDARDQTFLHLTALLSPGEAHELRALRLPGGRAISLVFDCSSVDRAVQQAAAWDEARAGGVYVTLNPVHPTLLQAQCAARDDVVRRRWVLIDLDPVRFGEGGAPLDDQTVPSTDAERASASAVMEELGAMLRAEGVRGLLKVDSGNGYHLLVPVNMPNDDGAREVVRRLLTHLQKQYGSAHVTIDAKTFNASRITKVPGTVARKGNESAGRPHRRAALLAMEEASEDARQANAAAIRGLVERYDLIDGAGRGQGVEGAAPRKLRWDRIERARRYLRKKPAGVASQPACPEEGNLNHGHDQTWHAVATVVQGLDLTEEEALEAVQEWNARCRPPWSRSELLHKIRQAIEKEPEGKPRGYLLHARSGQEAEDEGGEVTADDVAGIGDLIEAGAQIDWLWEHWVQRGVLTVIASEPGVGKTRFVADLIRRIRHGMPWPDGQNMSLDANSRVLYVPSDNNHDELATLAKSFDIIEAIKLNARKRDPYGGVLLETEDDLRRLEAHINAVQPVMVVIDTTGNATDKNVCRAEEAKEFFQPLQVIARKYRVAVLCLTHLNATGGVLGRRALEKARVALRLLRPDPEGQPTRRRLEVVKSNSKYPPPLGVTMHDGGNDYDARPPEEPRAAATPRCKRPTAVDEAAAWLAGELADGPVLLSDLRERAGDAGHSVKAMYAARDSLGVVPQGQRNIRWSLPGRQDEEE